MADERKTLEQRNTMSDIERLRHSAAHVLATAILRIWPEAQFAAGPPVENGFYYDVDLPHRISTDDFEKIEAEMKKEIKANHVFERSVVSREEALALVKAHQLDLAEQMRGAMLQRLERADLGAELLTLAQVAERALEGFFRNAEQLRREHGTAGVEDCIEHDGALVERADHIAVAHSHVAQLDAGG